MAEEILRFAEKQLDEEKQRGEAIEGKISSLLGQSGLAVAVAGGLGGILAQTPTAGAFFSGSGRYELWAYFVALGLGTAATMSTIWSALVRRHALGIDEKVLLNSVVLKISDDDQDLQKGLAHYRRYLTAHLWQIHQEYFERNESKAGWLKCSQILFLSFIIFVSAIGGIMTKKLAEQPAKSAPSSDKAPSPLPASERTASPPASRTAGRFPPPATPVPPGGKLEKLNVDVPKGAVFPSRDDRNE